MGWLYGIVLKVSAAAILRCILGFLLPAGELQKSAARGVDLIIFWMLAEGILSAWQEAP